MTARRLAGPSPVSANDLWTLPGMERDLSISRGTGATGHGPRSQLAPRPGSRTTARWWRQTRGGRPPRADFLQDRPHTAFPEDGRRTPAAVYPGSCRLLSACNSDGTRPRVSARASPGDAEEGGTFSACAGDAPLAALISQRNVIVFVLRGGAGRLKPRQMSPVAALGISGAGQRETRCSVSCTSIWA